MSQLVPDSLRQAPRGRRDSPHEALAAHDAVLMAHYDVDGALQDLALATGGFVGDSLEMARFGRDHPASTLVVAGVTHADAGGQLLPGPGAPTRSVFHVLKRAS